MESFPITISSDKAVHYFRVNEHPHHDGERCKYGVFEDGSFVASFQPGAQNYLHICQNAGGMDKEILYLLADEIKALIPPAESKHFNDDPS